LQAYGMHSCGSGRGPLAGSCEHGHESSNFMKGGALLDQLSNY